MTRRFLILVALSCMGLAAFGWTPDALEERFRVIVLADESLLLMPKDDDAPYRTIELVDGAIHIDGEETRRRQVRFRLGSDAEAVLDWLEASDEGPSAEEIVGRGSLGDREDVRVEIESWEDVEGSIADDHGDLVRIGGSVHVGPGEVRAGDVVAVGGAVEIEGEVRGDVVGVLGGVWLGPGAVITGDAVSVGGKLRVAPTAEVRGDQVSLPFLPAFVGGEVRHEDYADPDSGGLVSELVFLLILALLACLVAVIGSRPLDRIQYAVLAAPWRAGLVGLAIELLTLPTFVLTVFLLAVSIIGIPVLVIFVPVALIAGFVALLVGWAAMSRLIGARVLERLGRASAPTFVAVVVGSALLMSADIIAEVFGFGGGPLALLASALGLIGFLVQYSAWTIGLGGVVLTRFGTRYGWSDSYGPNPPDDDFGPFDLRSPDLPPSGTDEGPGGMPGLPAIPTGSGPPAPTESDGGPATET